MEDSAEVFVPGIYKERGIKFFNDYESDLVIICPEQKMKGLKTKPQRVCRFCKEKYGEVFFKGDAHVIPRLLGNEYLVSDYECDNCNAIFSNYETHLSNFLGPLRAFQKVYGIQGNYKFKSPNRKTIVENFNAYKLENSFSISREDVEDQTFDFNREAGETKINFTKHSYSPLLVYKSILKIALTCLPEDQVKNYELAFKYLTTNLLDAKIKGAAKILNYLLPPSFCYSSPFACIYKKKIDKDKLCTHVFVLYFQNQIYQIILPLNRNDLVFYNGDLVDVIYCPPLFGDLHTANSVQINERLIDMSSVDLLKGEKETIGFKYDVIQYKDAVIFDTITNEFKEDGFNFNAITKIIIMPENSKMSVPDKKEI